MSFIGDKRRGGIGGGGLGVVEAVRRPPPPSLPKPLPPPTTTTTSPSPSSKHPHSLSVLTNTNTNNTNIIPTSAAPLRRSQSSFNKFFHHHHHHHPTATYSAGGSLSPNPRYLEVPDAASMIATTNNLGGRTPSSASLLFGTMSSTPAPGGRRLAGNIPSSLGSNLNLNRSSTMTHVPQTTNNTPLGGVNKSSCGCGDNISGGGGRNIRKMEAKLPQQCCSSSGGGGGNASKLFKKRHSIESLIGFCNR